MNNELNAALDALDRLHGEAEYNGCLRDFRTVKAALTKPTAQGADVTTIIKNCWREEAEKMVTDAEIEKAFQGTNFGGGDPRKIVAETLLQLNGDYSSGHTATVICRELGLLAKNGLSKKGRRYLHHCFTREGWSKQPPAAQPKEGAEI